LELLADGKPIVTPTRATIGKAAGIDRAPTISRALTALEAAGWIDRVHVPVTVGGRQTATLLRIVLRRRERKVFLTAHHPVENGKCSKGRERKVFQDSLKREGVSGPLTRPALPNDTKPEPLAELDPETKLPKALLEMQRSLAAKDGAA
jgi:hypothetical protein